jgi:opacity protein-like surface antigen
MSGWLAAVRAFDELGRRVFAEAAATTLAVVLAAAVTYGLLQAYVGVPPLHGFVVFAVGGVTYGLASAAAWRRYR